MDPVSQLVWGAALSAGAVLPERQRTRVALFSGGIAGLLADLDVFIRSPADPLLQIEYHRHFTHSLAFIPPGALLALLIIVPVLAIFRIERPPLSQLYLYTLLGYGSHGILDACTSYGTQLLWPFSTVRIAWSIVAIVDPFFTVTILGLLVASFVKRSPRLARTAVLFGLVYLSMGALQRGRAESLAIAEVTSRGESLGASGCEAKPAPLSLLLWRTICETDDGRFLIDAWHVGIERVVYYPGGEVKRFIPERDAPWLADAPRQQRDFKRFEWFSSGFVVTHPDHGNVVADVRYSLIPNRIAPLWGIELDASDTNPSRPTPWRSFRTIRDGDWEIFLGMVRGTPLAR